MAKPAEYISTTECAIKHRVLPGPAGGKVRWNPDLTPYMVGIQDTSDIPMVRVVAVKGPARSGKTVGLENRALKHWIYGPSVNVLWYMQSNADIDDFMEERGEWMLENHEQVAAKIKWNDRRNSRSRKRIGGKLARWLPATKGTTRGKAAPLIGADEIDGYPKAVRRSIVTRLINRQREFGTAALAYICSHPDEGPAEGIDAVLRDSLEHFWWWQCQACGFYSSPSPDMKHRMNWNVADLLKRYIDMERGDLLNRIEAEAELICPHCDNRVKDDPKGYLGSERDKMNRAGVWLQPHQHIDDENLIQGEAHLQEYMGFTIHGFMSPFVTIGGLAREWVAAKLEADRTGLDTGLKEVVVKSLGETYLGNETEKQIDDWQTVKRRLRDTSYLRGTVPSGVRFLTAFVDIQGDRFEVRVIGWDEHRESWLIDWYAIKQPPPDPKTGQPAFTNIDPAHRLADWDVLENGVLNQTYPLALDPRLHLPIARICVDTGGEDETTINARKWAAKVVGRPIDPIPLYRILLTKGSNSKQTVTYGKPRKVEYDDEGKPLAAAVWERTVNVHEIKNLIAMRMKKEEPGPGRMHLPAVVKDYVVRELCAEQLVNGAWTPIQRRNETWDGWVACEVGRETLDPPRPAGQQIDWERPPVWAKPFEKGKERGIEVTAPAKSNIWDRLRQINRSDQAEE